MEQRHGRNTVFLAMVESLWGVGMNLVSVGTVIPVFLLKLGATNAVIGLLPSLGALGAGSASIFASYLTHRSRGIKGWVLGIHLLAPTPLAVISLGLLAGVRSPVLLVLACWGVYYALLGLLFPMWLDYMARILDPARRGRAFGVIFLVQTIAGASGVSLAAWLLKLDTGLTTYALLFCLSWLAAVVGSLFFMGTVEAAPDSPPESRSFLQHLGELLGLIRETRWLQLYVSARCLIRGTYPLIINFYAAYAVAQKGATVAEAALYGAAGLLCQAASGLLFGYLGDRTGHRLPTLIGQGALVVACVLVLLPLPAPAFFLVASLTGVYLSTEFSSQLNWLMDLSPSRDRQSVLSLVGFLLTPAAVLTPLAGGFLMDAVGFPAVAAAVGALLLLAMAIELALIPSRPVSKSGRSQGEFES
jgi:MFS family permease